MRKRLSKSESKRQRRKIRLKRQKKLNLSNEGPAFSFHFSKKALAAGSVLSILFFLFFPLTTPSAMLDVYEREKINIKKLFKNKEKASLPVSEPSKLNRQVNAILEDTPMEVMAEEISKKDKAVAGFIVGIAMKESKFGRYAPKKNGVDCYNYWGYRGKENPTNSGYSCFDSPSHAISVVGGKIDSMVKRGAKTPEQMISWKCGSTCAGHSPESVSKWIKDVGIHYYQILNDSKEIAKIR